MELTEGLKIQLTDVSKPEKVTTKAFKVLPGSNFHCAKCHKQIPVKGKC